MIKTTFKRQSHGCDNACDIKGGEPKRVILVEGGHNAGKSTTQEVAKELGVTIVYAQSQNVDITPTEPSNEKEYIISNYQRDVEKIKQAESDKFDSELSGRRKRRAGGNNRKKKKRKKRNKK